MERVRFRDSPGLVARLDTTLGRHPFDGVSRGPTPLLWSSIAAELIGRLPRVELRALGLALDLYSGAPASCERCRPMNGSTLPTVAWRLTAI